MNLMFIIKSLHNIPKERLAKLKQGNYFETALSFRDNQTGINASRFEFKSRQNCFVL